MSIFEKTHSFVTLKDIAEFAGVSPTTVYKAVKNDSGFLCGLARELGYKTPSEKAAAKPVKHWYNGNFQTREEEVNRMKELRGEGYSNAEIARMIGRTPQTIRRALGHQDKAMTYQNRVMGLKIRALKNAARKQYVLEKPIREYNARVIEHNKLKAQMLRLEAEIQPQTDKIVSIATIAALNQPHTMAVMPAPEKPVEMM